MEGDTCCWTGSEVEGKEKLLEYGHSLSPLSRTVTASEPRDNSNTKDHRIRNLWGDDDKDNIWSPPPPFPVLPPDLLPPLSPSNHPLSGSRVTPIPFSMMATAQVVNLHSPGLASLFQHPSSSIFCLISSDFYVFSYVSRFRCIDIGSRRRNKEEIKEDKEERRKKGEGRGGAAKP
ncbi:hypothetical protein E2C01_022016 [Portunus trituberculatus]|uniref:Uncharacterized protein n=1 Tax=Portunus trituberculatus TaxID=210409 RepID=A0A5B7E656_PORTR|nr:hypothetical protein [Portunus trituberculatus]